MLLPIDMKFAARKVHFLQNEGPKFEPVGNFTVPLPCVPSVVVKTLIPARFTEDSVDMNLITK